MNQEDLDRILGSQGNIVPSSGFVGNVMNAIERAATTPPPIPFPWKYAVAGLTVWLIALVPLVFFAHDVSPARWAPGAASMLAGIIEGLKDIDGGWIAVALLVSAASVSFSMRMAGARG